MILPILLALLAVASAKSGDTTMLSETDCKAERVALLKTIKPLVNPNATLESKEDQDPNTVEFFYVENLPAAQAHVSADGQVIYIPLAMAEDTAGGAKLFAAAIDRLLALKIGPVCSPL